jgi:predicted nucleic acid-binding protein
MRVPRIYLETSIFNFYVEETRDAHADTVRLFSEIAAGKYKAFTSTLVTDELERAPLVKQNKMLNLITEYGIVVLAPDPEAAKMADIYVSENVIPVKYRIDGLHIALAAVSGLDMIISMNFKHIVKRKTKLLTASLNSLHGYRAIEIYSPMEVIENENG